jgi:ribonuclease HI
MPDLPVLTSPTTVTVSGHPTAIHSLPPNHLPVTKYISVNRDDAIDLHRHLCQHNESVWYADGSSRAGEGWSAAVQWILDSGRSGSKMRGCVGAGDALDAEIGGICKAVEGFQELLHQSIKSATPMSHELIVFCDSSAAIVSIDTSSRPESIHFEKLWRSICADYLHAHLTLVWIPKGSNIEGHTLANRIAVVGASNSYLKKKKEGSLPEAYRRPGGGDPAPGGSTEGGPWQRGDADPSRRKSPFQRPKPIPLSPAPALMTKPESSDGHGLSLELAPIESSEAGRNGASDHILQHEMEDEAMQPREGSVFVTRYVGLAVRNQKPTISAFQTRCQQRTLGFCLPNSAKCA